MTNDTTKHLATFEPSVGVIMYQGPAGKNYLQVHTIHKNDKKYTWGEGRPFQREQLQDLATAIKQEQFATLKLKGCLPENVLFFQPALSEAIFAWYIPPQQHYITFTKQVKLASRKYRFPGLVMAVTGKTLYVFAVKGKIKPTGKSILYHAPFYNVYQDGEVCMGTISESRRKVYLHEEIDRWQRRFFGGEFTSAHGHDDQLAKGYTMIKTYGMMKGASFPEKALKPLEGTLDSFLSSVQKGDKND